MNSYRITFINESGKTDTSVIGVRCYESVEETFYLTHSKSDIILNKQIL